MSQTKQTAALFEGMHQGMHSLVFVVQAQSRRLGVVLSGALLKGNVPNQEKLNTVRFCCFKFVFAVFQSMHVEFMNVYKFTDLYKT